MTIEGENERKRSERKKGENRERDSERQSEMTVLILKIQTFP